MGAVGERGGLEEKGQNSFILSVWLSIVFKVPALPAHEPTCKRLASIQVVDFAAFGRRHYC